MNEDDKITSGLVWSTRMYFKKNEDAEAHVIIVSDGELNILEKDHIAIEKYGVEISAGDKILPEKISLKMLITGATQNFLNHEEWEYAIFVAKGFCKTNNRLRYDEDSEKILMLRFKRDEDGELLHDYTLFEPDDIETVKWCDIKGKEIGYMFGDFDAANTDKDDTWKAYA